MTVRTRVWVSLGCGLVAVTGLGLVVANLSCSSAPTPFVIRGPDVTGNEPPTLTILEPTVDLVSSQGNIFVIRWTDSDRDSNATISFALTNTVTGEAIPLVDGIDENDTTGADSVSVGTSAVPVGIYQLQGTIDDNNNLPVATFANTGGAAPRNILVNVVPPGQGPLTSPPTVTVTQPAFNLSVAQDDILQISVQPTEFAPGAANPFPFDNDSDITLYILLDNDLDPNNDDPANPGSGIIVLRRQIVPVDASQAIPFDITIDLNQVPLRADGQPYFIRATVDDLSNPAVHGYAVGTINVVSLASGSVDLFQVGKSIAGARFYGFNPGAFTGSSISSIGDFDADGVADFVLIAQFGNPRNFGLVGEGYIIYGLNRVRFGGDIPVNAVAESISGTILEAPPVREFTNFGVITGDVHTNGITSVSSIRDLTGDGRPEIMIGLSRVIGVYDSQDYDPGDEDPDTDATEEVNLTFTEGVRTVQVEDGFTESAAFAGVADLTINSASPTTPSGSDGGLFWRDDPAAGVRQWALIKFGNILEEIPDIDSLELVDPSTINAQLEFRVFNTGGSATVHQLLVDFTEQTTFSTFAGGRAPTVVTDYLMDDVGMIDGESTDTVMVDVSQLVLDLLNGVLRPFNDEIRLILVPQAMDGENETGVRSTEFSALNSRPILRLNYSRANLFGAQGCYNDPWVNNRTDQPDDRESDLYAYSGGMAVQINSQNRDTDGPINVNRLENTSVHIELVGQEAHVLSLDGVNQTGGIFPQASNAFAEAIGAETVEAGRISGVRYVAGWYDDVDHNLLNQPPREDLFGQTVGSIGDLDNDGVDELVFSAPRNERYLLDLFESYGFQSTQWWSTAYRGSITVIPGFNYNVAGWRDKNDSVNATSAVPVMDQQRFPTGAGGFGSCTNGVPRNGPVIPAGSFEVFAENVDDFLGDGQSARDFNQDGVDDILCGAPLNDRTNRTDSGATYILYGRNVIGDFSLSLADDSLLRPPMLRIRGVKSGDQIGWRQTTGLDVNGDRVDDIFLSSPRTDFGAVSRGPCGGDFNRDGVFDSADLATTNFNSCRNRFSADGEDMFSSDACKVFDYDNDFDIDPDDSNVFECLQDGGSDCCANLVDNGFVAIIFGGVFVDGDRDITQIATSDLPGTVFLGTSSGDRAGVDISSAGDFNQDGFGDLLIVVPGETRIDRAGRPRLGVVYLVFGGGHLENTTWNLSQVGTEDLPGIVFLSPYVKGRPNEAAPAKVAFLGDVNNDGFGDIAIGNPKADFIDLSFPQGPEASGSDADVGRRRNAGDAYIIYGNNFGTNRSQP
ncbi:MAG: hypothetical protein AABZ47_15625 [Planctomycetota bacterium]